MTRPLELFLPMPPNVANARMHWRKKHRERRSYFALCDALQGVRKIPPPPPAPFARATLASTMRLGAAMDDDNAMARHKWALDWLVTRGYLVDDRRTCLKWVGLPRQVVQRGGVYRLELTLTPRAA